MYREGRVSDWGGGDNTGRTSSSNNKQRRETLHLGGSADRFATQLGGRSGTHLLSRFPPLVTTYLLLLLLPHSHSVRSTPLLFSLGFYLVFGQWSRSY
ncbi:hypothetical protein ASPFODRAFT_661908 [Aspergillus luchuensis CBS 106.47]|uniref:Uncharacterized protein n=1 Tax=Aspergillus luchuensis (strain CBS 106.47) TaxID=1137211 RepID=A0A1M3TF33_ASPLC|nr:hypothetical protein ASPFODRAFT_661908 [Aspergillus luchuensis CBS 106.47]